MAAIKVTVLLLVFIYSCRASNTGGSSTSFSIDNLLTCRVPFSTRNGLMAVPERTLSVSLLAGSSTPAPSGFQLPVGEPNQANLRAFLGTDFNPTLTSIAARSGSFDQRMSDPIPITGEFGEGADAVIRMFLDSRDAGRCTFQREWRQLDNTFFPRYYAAGTCSSNNCSVPAGLRCQADLSAQTTAIGLRWDCCQSFIASNGRYAVQCGWRKVTLPFLNGCRCAC